MSEYDVIVIGLGGAGSSCAFHSASAGLKVLGLEQFGPVHEHGSSHGRTRIFRTAYSEGPAYVPLSQRAQQLWFELQRDSREKLIIKTGGLFIGRRDTPTIDGALRSAQTYSLRHELLSAGETERRFPQFHPAEDEVAVWDPDAGVLFPENCVRADASAAVETGAQLRYGERVKTWSATVDSVTVTTATGEFTSRSLVVTAGPWVPQVLGDLRLPLEVVRQFVLWFPANGAVPVGPDRMPVFIWDRRPEIETYGVPDVGDGVKVGAWAGKPADTPEKAERVLREGDARPVRDFAGSCLRGVSPRETEWGSCLFTMAPDHNFLVGRHPRYPNVVILSACSGHGFKFASALGEAVSRMVTGDDPGYDFTIFDPTRF